MKIILRVVVIASAICAFQSANAATLTDLRDSNTNSAKFKDTPVPLLGGGYSNDMQSVVGLTCLKDGVIKFGDGGKVIISLGDKKSFSELESDLNIDVESNISIDVFSVDIAAAYARHIKEDAYSEGFYYFENIILPTKIFTPAGFGANALNDFGVMAYKAGPDQFRLSCGDEFIKEEPVGAKLITSLKLNFVSSKDKENFDIHVKEKVGSIFNASAVIQQAVNQYHISGTMEVSAYQEGGDPTQLINTFSKCGDHYCIAICPLNNLDVCKGIINGVIKYAQTNLINQVDFKDGKVIGNAQPLGYTYMPYMHIGLTPGSSVLTPEIIAARQMLGDLYKKFLEKVVFVDHLLNSKFALFIESDAHLALQEGSGLLHDNLAILGDGHYGAIACYLDPKRCVATAKILSQEMKPFDDKIIESFIKSFHLSSTLSGRDNFFVPVGNNSYMDSMLVNQEVWTLQFSSDRSSVKIDYFYKPTRSGSGILKKQSIGSYEGYVHDSHGDTDYYVLSSILNPG